MLRPRNCVVPVNQLDSANEKVVVELFNTRLVGKLLVDRSVNKNMVRAITLKAWRTSRGVQIINLKENIFLFKFASEGDRRRILELGPWNIEGYPLILKHWNQNQTAERCKFLKPPDMGFKYMVSQLNICQRKMLRK